MPGPYSSDPRIRAVEEVEQGKTVREIAKMFRLAVTMVVRLHQRYRRTGSVDPLPMGGNRRSSKAEQLSGENPGRVDEQSEFTPDEISGWPGKQGHQVSCHALWRLLKKKTLYAGEQNRGDVKVKRRKWERHR